MQLQPLHSSCVPLFKEGQTQKNGTKKFNLARVVKKTEDCYTKQMHLIKCFERNGSFGLLEVQFG